MEFAWMASPPPTQVGGGVGEQLVSWDEVFGSQGYVLEVGNATGLSNVSEVTLDPSFTSATISGLTPGNTYYVRVRSIAANGPATSANAGPASTELSFVAA